MFSRPVTRLITSSALRRSFATRANPGGRQQQQYQQWSRARLNMGRAAGTGAVAVALSGGLAFVVHASTPKADSKSGTSSKVDYAKVRKAIADLLDDNNYDDGSYGPLFVRLGWHASGTYSKFDLTGGSNGGCMRFAPESEWGANKGLHIARQRLESVYHAHPGLTYADLYTLAAVVAIEEMGGPTIKWRPGRSDFADGKKSPPDGRLPDAAQGVAHVREVFTRMGFNDRETVALIGAHSLGRCHIDRSGYDGPWTFAPTTFSNEYFRLLLEEKWQERRWKGPKQFEDSKTKSLMMVPADMALLQDAEYKKYVVEYAKDGDLFAKDFAAAFGKLLELGVDFKAADASHQSKNAPWWKRIFG